MTFSDSSYLKIWWIAPRWEAVWPSAEGDPGCHSFLLICVYRTRFSTTPRGCSYSLSEHTRLPVANPWKTTQLGSLLCVQRDYGYPLRCASLRPIKHSQSKEQGCDPVVCADPGSSLRCGNHLHTSLFIHLGLQMAGSTQHLIWRRIIKQLINFPKKIL